MNFMNEFCVILFILMLLDFMLKEIYLFIYLLKERKKKRKRKEKFIKLNLLFILNILPGRRELAQFGDGALQR